MTEKEQTPEQLKNEIICLKQQRKLMQLIITTQAKQLADINSIITKGGVTQTQTDKLIAEMGDA